VVGFDLVDFQVVVVDNLEALVGVALEGVPLLSIGVLLVEHFLSLVLVAHHLEVELLHLVVVVVAGCKGLGFLFGNIWLRVFGLSLWF